MKYICFSTEEGIEEIIMFPPSINHDVMAESVGWMRNHMREGWQRVTRNVVSAGFVSPAHVCFGESFSLGISSRDEDTGILRKQLGVQP